MNYEEVEDSMLAEIAEATKCMCEIQDDERIAFEMVRDRIVGITPEKQANLLTLALMTLAANAIATNERIFGDKKNRHN